MGKETTRLRAAFQKIIHSVPDSPERKRITMLIYLVVVQSFLSVVLFLLVWIITDDSNGPFYTPLLMIISGAALVLILKGKYRLARAIDLLALNILLLFLSQRLGSQSGFNYYYVAAGTASVALYGFEEWRTGVIMASLSLALFIFSEAYVLDFVPIRELTTVQKSYLSMINSTMTFFISTYCIVTMLKLNFESEKGMFDNQRIIELQNEELKKTNKELDRFVYSASHDLRAPLSSISGLVNLMELEKGHCDPRYISLIKERVKAMEVFISEIVTYSRNSRLAPDIRSISLLDLINDVIDSLAFFENAHKMKVSVHVPKDLIINTDKDRLKIVLNNLLTNSIKYADFAKSNSFIEVNAVRKEGRILIEIKDNGIGIDDLHQERIFDMFYRATERSTGSGLGLYIAREAVEKLGGKILAQSEANSGSTFSLELPVG